GVTGVPFIPATGAHLTLDVLNLGDPFNQFPDKLAFGPADVTRMSKATFTLTGDQRGEIPVGARVTAGELETFVKAITFDGGTNRTIVTVSKAELPDPLGGVTIGTPAAPAIDFDFTGPDELLAFSNTNFNFSSILDGLIALSKLLSQFKEF